MFIQIIADFAESHRFRSDPNEVDVAKVQCTEVPPEFLEAEYKECKPLDAAPNLLRPFSVGYIKGYKRCSLLLVVLDGIKTLQLEAEIPRRICVLWLIEQMSCGFICLVLHAFINGEAVCHLFSCYLFSAEASFGTINVNFAAYADVRSSVMANRGVLTLSQLKFFW